MKYTTIFTIENDYAKHINIGNFHPMLEKLVTGDPNIHQFSFTTNEHNFQKTIICKIVSSDKKSRIDIGIFLERNEIRFKYQLKQYFFTELHLDILRLTVEGYSAQDVAKALNHSSRGVEHYIKAMMKQLGVKTKSKVGLCKIALEFMLVK